MPKLLALDVALLPPPDVTRRAIDLSAALPAEGGDRLRLDDDHLPHITLTQQFVREEELDAAFAHIDDVLRGQEAIEISVSGVGGSGSTVWLAVEPTPVLLALHERLMESLRGLERPEGTPAAFVEGDARVRDVLWVASFRAKSSFGAYQPHITLGHGEPAPRVEPFTFTATTVAACHLGRFCTCRRVLRAWELPQP